LIDGPKPLEIARHPANWWIYSTQYFTAGQVLLETAVRNRRKWDEECVGRGVTEEHHEIRRRFSLDRPIIFNLAFSVELTVKAILVAQDPVRWVPENGRVRFGHDVLAVVTENTDLEFSENETKVLKRIGDYVSFGKYPERLKPGDTVERVEELFNYHPYVSWSLSEFFCIISSIREKLRGALFALIS